MKKYTGTFRKVDGSLRTMVFCKLEDLPDEFLSKNIIGSSGSSKTYQDSMELVWDLENDNFRVFNWATVEGEVFCEE